MIRLLQSTAIALLVCNFGVCAQTAIPDSEQPVNIQADNAKFDNEQGIAVYNGNVTIDQGSRHLASDILTIKRDHNNKIKIMIASGNPATFHSQTDPQGPIGSGKAKTIKYYPKQDSVDLIDDAELTQNGDTITGPVLNYNFTTGNLKSKGSPKARTTVTLQPRREK